MAKKYNIDRNAFGEFVEEENTIEGRGEFNLIRLPGAKELVARYRAAGGK